MALLQCTLTIDGVDYDEADRANPDICLDAWSWAYEDDPTVEFHERASGPQPQFHNNQHVSLTIDGTLRATGYIQEVQPQFTDEGWTFGYKTRGLKFLMNLIPITSTDGSCTILYNVSPDDYDNYIPARAGKSVGQIIEAVIDLHATALSAIGVQKDSTTSSQLAPLTLVPPEMVPISGERLANALESVLQRWARNIVMFIPADGNIRFYDTTTGTAITLTERLDPIEPIRFNRSITDCATRAVARGAGKIFPAYVSLLKGTFTAAWTMAQQNAWTYNDFAKPTGAYDKGTVVTILDPVTVRIQSDDVTATAGVNYMSSIQAWLYLDKSIATGIDYSESRPITANTTLTAGGTSDVTLGFPLENAASNAYTKYTLIGRTVPLGGGGFDRAEVYRRFHVNDPGFWIAQHLAKKFPIPVSFLNYTGNATEQTNYPEAVIVKGGITYPATFDIDPVAGDIVFHEPVVKAMNSMATLNTGGTGVAIPDDIYVLVAYSRGSLEAAYPADTPGTPPTPNYGGSAYTGPENLQRTAYFMIDSWVYAGNATMMQQFAEMMWKSMSDVILSGSITYRGAYTTAFNPGQRLSIAGNGYTTGLESANVPIRGVNLQFHTDGANGQLYTTTLTCSSRRNPATGERFYIHPTRWDQLFYRMDWAGFDNPYAIFAALPYANIPQYGAGGIAGAGADMSGYNPQGQSGLIQRAGGFNNVAPGDMARLGPQPPQTGGKWQPPTWQPPVWQPPVWNPPTWQPPVWEPPVWNPPFDVPNVSAPSGRAGNIAEMLGEIPNVEEMMEEAAPEPPAEPVRRVEQP
jgi:hypothetical protein